MNRREFVQTAGLAATAASLLPAAPLRKLKIGHTCITWSTFPGKGDDTTLESAVRDIAAEGFWAYETFPEVLDNWDQRGLLRALMDKHGLPLRSGYITGNLLDPSKRQDEIVRIKRLAGVIKKFGGTYAVLAPNGVKRDTYDFKEHRTDIVSALNDYSAAIVDMGLGTGLHQHTGTCIETRDEVYTVLDAVDTRYVKFGPDIGQLQKGGADPVKVVKDYLPLVRHMHLKDYDGGPNFAGYCPLGQGKVDIPAILDMVEAAKMQGMIMVELDPSRGMPITAGETARIAQGYLRKLGYSFRT